MPAALIAAVVLGGATAARLWAMLTLLHRYRSADYIREPKARMLYITNIVSAVIMMSAIVALAYLTKLWWVELAASTLAVAFVLKLVWGLWMRLSGRSEAFYEARRWR